MGHKRLGTLPKTKRWQQVIASLEGGESVAQVAAASSDAAEGALSRASTDPTLIRAFWLLTQLPLAARETDFPDRLRELGLAVGSSPQLFEIIVPDRLRELGLTVGSSPQLFEIIGAFSEAIDAHSRATHERSDLGDWQRPRAFLPLWAGRCPGCLGPNASRANLPIDLRAIC
jgi:hypothetical protein